MSHLLVRRGLCGTDLRIHVDNSRLDSLYFLGGRRKKAFDYLVHEIIINLKHIRTPFSKFIYLKKKKVKIRDKITFIAGVVMGLFLNLFLCTATSY